MPRNPGRTHSAVTGYHIVTVRPEMGASAGLTLRYLHGTAARSPLMDGWNDPDAGLESQKKIPMLRACKAAVPARPPCLPTRVPANPCACKS